MKNRLFIGLMLFAVLITAACCKDKCSDPANPDCGNYDACYGKKSTSAAFTIEERVGERYFETDTIGGDNLVRFTATEEADSYTWYLGSEVIKEKSFTRLDFPKNSNLKVKLVVNRTPNTACFPNDKGVDSLTRPFYVWPPMFNYRPQPVTLGKYFPIFGTYNGSLKSNPSLVFNTTLHDTLWTNDGGGIATVGIIRGIPYPPKFATDKLSRNYQGGDFFNDYSPIAISIYCTGWGSPVNAQIPEMRGYAWIDKPSSKKITIAYSHKDTLTGVWRKDTFVGNKIY
jgi:hypothetical protein